MNGEQRIQVEGTTSAKDNILEILVCLRFPEQINLLHKVK